MIFLKYEIFFSLKKPMPIDICPHSIPIRRQIMFTCLQGEGWIVFLIENEEVRKGTDAFFEIYLKI